MASEKTPKDRIDQEDDEDIALRQAREDQDDDGVVVIVPLKNEQGEPAGATMKYISGDQMRRINALLKANNERKRAK